ncbi:hypothetical protein PsYK624_015230 [Phanerochaete sordida]|uniref:Uncharacterized protein n=1 Tax=Phanerochaete sordida TaxID=48140 RepID=A0A9P3G0F8_9APHY|nr:hypothetical protein PsYK624_015230 [Phanerochaete sordida]
MLDGPVLTVRPESVVHCPCLAVSKRRQTLHSALSQVCRCIRQTIGWHRQPCASRGFWALGHGPWDSAMQP